MKSSTSPKQRPKDLFRATDSTTAKKAPIAPKKDKTAPRGQGRPSGHVQKEEVKKMEGRIDTSFTTEQRDLFASGLVAEIGVNAYAVWSAIKYFADYNTGHAWPGMRKLGEKLGLSPMTVKRAIDTLEQMKMVRIVAESTKRKGQTYIARERMSVRLGERIYAQSYWTTCQAN